MKGQWTDRVMLLAGMAMLLVLALSLFASAALQAARNPGGSGVFGRMALAAAYFPITVREAFGELVDYSTGEEYVKHLSVPRENTDLTGFQPLQAAYARDRQIDIPSGVLMRKGQGSLTPGWRLMAGVMEFDGVAEHAVLLLDPKQDVSASWRLGDAARDLPDDVQQGRMLIHSTELMDDGSIIFVIGGGYGEETIVQRRGLCGDVRWSMSSDLHHSVAIDHGSQTFWSPAYTLTEEGDPDNFGAEDAYSNGTFVEIDVETGARLRSVSVSEIINKNAHLGLFQIASKDISPTNANVSARGSIWMRDPFHFNDVEALPASIADAYPMFEAGDLLVNPRDLNTVFVVDPDTALVKWHHTGNMNRPHDPDWGQDGRITVYDNGMDLGRSRIIAIDPATNRVENITPGPQNPFYSRIQGRHTVTDTGNISVVSTQQGTVFEYTTGGQRPLELASLRTATSDRNFSLTQFQWLPIAALNLEDNPC